MLLSPRFKRKMAFRLYFARESVIRSALSWVRIGLADKVSVSVK